MYEAETLEVYRFCNIKSFPVDCGAIAESIGFKIKTYRETAETEEQLKAMLRESSDAYVDGESKTIYYNSDIRNERRIRFSLAHEIGHLIMMRKDEDIANDFASNLLCPRPIVYAHRFRTADQISQFFDISISAANVVVMNMRRVSEYLNPSGLKMIDYFDLRHKCIGIFPMYPIKDEPSTVRTLITDLKSQTKQKEDKERYRKQVRSLQGKIKRARLRMMEATDEVTYRKYQKKVWECEKHLDLIRGKTPFDQEYQMEDFENSIIYREGR